MLIKPAEESVQQVAQALRETLGDKQLEDIARECGLLKRRREIVPFELLMACISALGSSDVKWLADIVRRFNYLTGKDVKYKPFHNQLSKAAFPVFLRKVLERCIAKLTSRVLQGIPEEKLAQFRDIMAHDGCSFALKDALAEVFPGRFTKTSPAAVELHVTMSLFTDNPCSITVAPDSCSERDFIPEAETVRGCLLLEDRGYEDRRFFQAVVNAGGHFIVRGKKSIKPTIRKAYDRNGRRVRHLENKRLTWRRLPRHDVDLLIDWHGYQGRLVVFYTPGKRNRKNYVYLHTNLDRNTFTMAEVSQIYRLRWQVELLFKEWKSHANLHGFDTAKEAIAEGLIWASIIAATLKRMIAHVAERLVGAPLSTQRVAQAASNFFDDILKALLHARRSLPRILSAAFRYLSHNARRAHPKRDRATGRLAFGLQHTCAA